MTTLRIDDAVLAGYPEVCLAVVVAQRVDGGDHWADSDQALAGLESSVADGTLVPAQETDPEIAAWHAVYRRFGTNPRRTRASVDALCRRLARTGRLPRINGPVDAYNSISVAHGLPAGAFDLDAVRGDIDLRLARDGDVFTPLGEPDTLERPGAGEVVYADEESVLTRHWNHRDADRTKVTPASTRIAFILESAQGQAGPPLVEKAAAALAALVAPRAHRVTTHLLGAGARTAVPLLQES